MPHAITGRDKATRRAGTQARRGPKLTSAERNQVLDGMSSNQQPATSNPLDQARTAASARRIAPVAENSTCSGCGSTIPGESIIYDYTVFKQAGSIGHPVRTVFADCEHCGRTYAREQCCTGTLWIDRDGVALLDPQKDAAAIARVRAEIERRRGVTRVA